MPRHLFISDIAAVAKWADAFFEQSRDDDATPQEEADRDDGQAALERVQAWLKEARQTPGGAAA
jgi:hypothetical protein